MSRELMGFLVGVGAMIVIAVGSLLAIGNIQQEERYTYSCMDDVHTPDPEATDYDRQALEFSTQIRKCMRG